MFSISNETLSPLHENQRVGKMSDNSIREHKRGTNECQIHLAAKGHCRLYIYHAEFSSLYRLSVAEYYAFLRACQKIIFISFVYSRAVTGLYKSLMTVTYIFTCSVSCVCVCACTTPCIST